MSVQELINTLAENVYRSQELLEELLRTLAAQPEPPEKPVTPAPEPEADAPEPEADAPKRHGSRRERLFGPQPEPPADNLAQVPRGFRIIQCNGCGKRFFYFQREPADRCMVTCRSCGVITSLGPVDVTPVSLRCSVCGTTASYKTNIVDEEFSWPCMNCKAPTRLMRNYIGTAYVTNSQPEGGGAP